MKRLRPHQKKKSRSRFFLVVVDVAYVTHADYGGCIVSEKHFDRLVDMLLEDHGGRVFAFPWSLC